MKQIIAEQNRKIQHYEQKFSNTTSIIQHLESENFDFENIPDPTDPANIEKINGRGVFLMKNLADHVSFSDHGKVVQLDFEMEPVMVG